MLIVINSLNGTPMFRTGYGFSKNWIDVQFMPFPPATPPASGILVAADDLYTAVRAAKEANLDHAGGPICGDIADGLFELAEQAWNAAATIAHRIVSEAMAAEAARIAAIAHANAAYDSSRAAGDTNAAWAEYETCAAAARVAGCAFMRITAGYNSEGNGGHIVGHFRTLEAAQAAAPIRMDEWYADEVSIYDPSTPTRWRLVAATDSYGTWNEVKA